MNAEQDRPYACTAPGCSQRFHSEDHLMIHRHKHEMTLTFPSIRSDNTLSDQTPTPTRFLRNCEEVGLFSEIDFNQQEEQDTKQNLPLYGPSGPTQNQSHQNQNQDPQIHIEHPGHLSQCSQSQSQCSESHRSQCSQSHPPQCSQSQSCMVVRRSGSSVHQTLPSSQSSSAITQTTINNTQSVPSCLRRQRQPAPTVIPGASTAHMETQMTMRSNIIGIPGPPHLSSCSSPQRSKAAPGHPHSGVVSNGNPNPMGHMMDVMSSRQSHLHPQAPPPNAYQQQCRDQSQQRHSHLHHSHSQSHHGHPHHSPPPHLSHPGSAQQPSPHQALHPMPAQMSPVPPQALSPRLCAQAGGGRRRRNSEVDPDERRLKFLERNRAAATRCRQKRKVWVGALEKKAEELVHTNLQLQNEVTSLRSEVTQLKQILLTHKECPVTARQRETQGYMSPVGRETGSPAQQVIQHNSITTSTANNNNNNNTGI